MRALVCKEFGAPENLVIEELPVPEPGAGQVQVEVRAAGVNFPDLLMIAGQYQVKTPPPFVPGAEAAGVVTAVGDDVARTKLGDEVIAMPLGGAFSEICVADEISTVPKPRGLSFEQAAGFAITYFTTMHAFRQSAASAAPRSSLRKPWARALLLLPAPTTNWNSRGNSAPTTSSTIRRSRSMTRSSR